VKKLIIFMMLIYSCAFAKNYETVIKVPVQLDKIPEDVTIDGKSAVYLLRCELRDTNGHPVSEEHIDLGATAVNKNVDVTFNLLSSDMRLVKNYFCQVFLASGLGNIIGRDIYTTKKIESEGIANLPLIQQVNDKVYGHIE
jgi:hypothetical protein